MIIDIKNFYEKVAKAPSLSNNLLSIIFAKHPNIDISARESYFEKISPFYRRYKLADRSTVDETETLNEGQIKEWLGLDLRIEDIKLDSIRSFPPQTDNIPFGIDFKDEGGEPQSMIILGANAFGKSSIYDAIEYSFCQKIGEAQLRTSIQYQEGSDYFKKFIQFFDSPFSKSRCLMKLKCGKTFDISKENIPNSVKEKINPNTHFISDYDIYTNGQLNYLGNDTSSFQNLIARSIGLSELLQKEKELFAFASYGRKVETTRRNNLEREIKNSEEIISNNSKLIDEKRDQLGKLQRDQPLSLGNQDKQKTLTTIQKLKESEFNFSFDSERLIDASKEFSILYDEFTSISSRINEISKLQFLNEGLKLLHEEQSCPICNNSNLGVDEIKKHLEERIKRLEEFNKLSADLNRLSNVFTSLLNELSSKLVALRGKAVFDLSQIKEDANFSELSKSTNDYLTYLNDIYSQDIFQKTVAVNDAQINYINKLMHLKEIAGNYPDFFLNLKSYSETIPLFNSKRKNIITQIEDKLRSKDEATSKEGLIAVLISEIAQLKKQIDDEQKSIIIKKPELSKLNETLELYSKVKDETRQFVNEFHKELSLEIKSAFEPIKSIIKDIIDKYLYLDDKPAKLVLEMIPEAWDEETGEIISEIITAYIEPLDSSYGKIEVNKYFNTFHYRLFCTMTAMSIAVASRKSTGINLPLVMDDVFYASDFENRATIEEFIIKIFEIFKQFTPDKQLQLILFTHDQLIFESILKATKMNGLKDILFAKLFKYEDAELMGKDFKDLVYRLPISTPDISKIKV
jgi:hypothetical protein